MTTSFNKIKRHSQDNMGVYHFVSRTKTRDKIATMYNILIIYSSKKDTLDRLPTHLQAIKIVLLVWIVVALWSNQCHFNVIPRSNNTQMYTFSHMLYCLWPSTEDLNNVF